MLERDAPLPAGFAGAGQCERRRLGHSLRRDRCRPVVGQPLAPVLEPRAIDLLDDEAAEARAVDEEVAADGRAVLHVHRFDITGLAVLADVDDLALLADDAAALGITAQIGGVGRGVELEGVIDVRLRPAVARRHPAELADAGRLRFRAEAKLVRVAPRLGPSQPILNERNARSQVGAEQPEIVEIAVAELLPVDELDAEFEGRIGLTDELVLVDPEELVELLDRRDRRLADADGSDLFGLDEGDPVLLAPGAFRERRRRHPAGRSAADDHDVAKGPIGHPFTSSLARCSTPRKRFTPGIRFASSATSRSRCWTLWICASSLSESTRGS